MTHRHWGNPMDAARMAEASDHLVPEDGREPWTVLDIAAGLFGVIALALGAVWLGHEILTRVSS